MMHDIYEKFSIYTACMFCVVFPNRDYIDPKAAS